MAYFIMMRMQERSDNRVPLTSQINSWNSENLISECVYFLGLGLPSRRFVVTGWFQAMGRLFAEVGYSWLGYELQQQQRR